MPSEKVLEIINSVKSEGRKVLTFYEAMRLAAEYGLPVPRVFLAKNPDEAVEYAKQAGFPVVLKIVSPDITHKSDIGGVVVGLNSEEEVRKSFTEIMERVKVKAPSARVHGICVHHMAPYGREVIIGGIVDETFGPVIMFGLGGIFVEILRDVTFRLAPLTREEAWEMIESIKGAPILKGYRGEPPADLDALVDTMVKASQMLSDLADYVHQLDLNPVFVYEKGRGVKIVDVRVVLK
ncbi:MAG: acetyl-CoA synthetase [Thermoprotei archaeon]|nr:MAG: acetyl-CoA synthetase [Thermoprotei archaeon]RLE56820.1 MAG: acetyl-CoA synthetase [Thermoprotei archaeon]